jgi:cell shape-determining protein MreC
VNSRRTSQTKKIRALVLISVFVLCAIFLLPKVFAGAAALVLSPVHALEEWLSNSSASFPYYLRDRSVLIEEINTLKSNNAAQSGERYTLQLLAQENEALRLLLGDTQEQKIVAGIIGRPNRLPYDVLVVDKGAQDNIVEGAPVFIGKHTVIGVVEKVFDKSSIVQLVTSPGFKASVYIIGPDIYTTAEGVGGGQLRVGVPQGIALAVGDLVILPSASTGVYGEISVVDSVATRPEQYGYVSLSIPLSSLRLVSIGDAPLEPVTFEEAQAAVREARTEAFFIPIPEDLLITAQSSSTATTIEQEENQATPPSL